MKSDPLRNCFKTYNSLFLALLEKRALNFFLERSCFLNKNQRFLFKKQLRSVRFSLCTLFLRSKKQ